MIVFILTLSLFTLGACKVIYDKMVKIEKDAIERDKVFQDWLFKSLYSIKPTVLKPSEIEKPVDLKPGSVYSPTKDPMAMFRGNHEDYYE